MFKFCNRIFYKKEIPHKQALNEALPSYKTRNDVKTKAEQQKTKQKKRG
jgi:hypothetical protein